MKKQNAFTLMEIIIVVIILGVIVSFTIPKLASTFEKTKSQEGVQILLALFNAEKLYKVENNAYADDVSKLDVEFPNASNFNVGSISIAANATAFTAEISKTDNAYYLTIDQDGVIGCGGSTQKCGILGY